MALPRENRTAKVIAVEEAVKKMSLQEFAAHRLFSSRRSAAKG
jgi:hypothetical protein